MTDVQSQVEDPRPIPRGAAAQVAAAAEPLPDIDDPAFGRLFDRFGDARVVLLGASTDGTAEFCRARAAITRWLVEHRGFNIVALDTDWPDARPFDARARHRKAPRIAAAPPAFPSWVWRNREFEAFLDALAEHNRGRPPGAQAGIYGLDRYNPAGSMAALVEHLTPAYADAAAVASERYGCLTPWAQEAQVHGRTAVSGRYAACEGAVTHLLSERLERQMREAPLDEEGLFDAGQSARLLREAEAHYRAMYYGGGEAWNRRSSHMFETLQALLKAKGTDAKAVVWAHNAHVGDARATEMGHVRDELNLGQLCREAHGPMARLIGLGTHAGTVACAPAWGAPVEVRTLTPSLAESQERCAHNVGLARYLLDLRPNLNNGLGRALADPRLERFIGAVYRPDTERWSHYAECRLPEQYDAWAWFDETTAVTALG